MHMTKDAILIDEMDSVAVVIRKLTKGQSININGKSVTVKDDIPVPHKIALKEIKRGDSIFKYGYSIGFAAQDIKEGQWVHIHNIKSALTESVSYEYHPSRAPALRPLISKDLTFNGYKREDGGVGIRNYVFIIPTVFCVNKPITRLAEMANREMPPSDNFDGFIPFTHECGCAESGKNLSYTRSILGGILKNPNAAGVLVVSLGCEINDLESFKPTLGDYDPGRVKFIVCQDVDDEFEESMKLLRGLHERALSCKREPTPISKLIIGSKCGGSDAFSGLTANPLVGEITDILTAQGGTSVITEVPEMFGAEQILMDRAVDESIFHDIVKLINDGKAYYMKYGIEVYKNPSKGNYAGGLSTLEEKSLGCTEKGGKSRVTGVIPFGERVSVPGLNLFEAPGHDLVCITGMVAAGCTLIIFTTGRGTPGGFAAPVLRVTTNSDIFNRKRKWNDFDAGRLLSGTGMEQLTEELLELILKVANGEIRTNTEINNYFEMSIWRDGITT
ncbi:MAG: altronate dehydratase family protein [Desulfobacterales bacterium]|jgi:altronate hydrolase